MPSPNEQAEKVFYQVGSTIVTNTRFATFDQTFSIQKIASVRGTETPARYVGSIAGIFSGAIVSFVGFHLPEIGLVVGGLGILIIALSVLQLTKQKRYFSIILGIGGNEVTAYRSTSRDVVDKIIQAINQAIISRG
jgi:Family of unknown function (DUF6232)